MRIELTERCVCGAEVATVWDGAKGDTWYRKVGTDDFVSLPHFAVREWRESHVCPMQKGESE